MVELFGQVWFVGVLAFLAGAAMTGLVVFRRRPPGPSESRRRPDDEWVRPQATGRVPEPRGPADEMPDIPAQGGPVDGPPRTWKPDPP
jgi:hypothetical protein